jgi:hypothetical protein
MSAELVSTCDPNSEGGSILTFVNGVGVVRRTRKVSRVHVAVPDNVTPEIPIVLRICGPHTVNPRVNNKQGKDADLVPMFGRVVRQTSGVFEHLLRPSTTLSGPAARARSSFHALQ